VKERGGEWSWGLHYDCCGRGVRGAEKKERCSGGVVTRRGEKKRSFGRGDVFLHALLEEPVLASAGLGCESQRPSFPGSTGRSWRAFRREPAIGLSYIVLS
jgi:hypothetical protein